MTALIYAAKHGHVDVISLLLQAKAFVNVQDEVSVRLSRVCWMRLISHLACRTARRR